MKENILLIECEDVGIDSMRRIKISKEMLEELEELTYAELLGNKHSFYKTIDSFSARISDDNCIVLSPHHTLITKKPVKLNI